MAITADVLDTFATLDTSRQVSILRRVGIDTDCADALLGRLAGMFPERFTALSAALDRVAL